MRRVRFCTQFIVIISCTVLAAACADEASAPEETSDGITAQSKWDAERVTDYPYPVEMLANEAPSEDGRHFAQGEFAGYNTVDYDTVPPTSGKHIGELAMPGVYDGIPIPNEVVVHNMEHGYVIVWYNCNADPMLDSEGCGGLLNTLTAWAEPLVAQSRSIVVTPHSTMESRIALTAWQFRDTIDEVDPERIQTFIDTFECHYDPEGTCG